MITTPQLLTEDMREVITDDFLIEHSDAVLAMPKHEFFEIGMESLRTET